MEDKMHFLHLNDRLINLAQIKCISRNQKEITFDFGGQDFFYLEFSSEDGAKIALSDIKLKIERITKK